MVSWLKAERGTSDGLIAVMRGVSVVAGLGGTFVFQILERNLGLLRSGAWSLWFEVISLVPIAVILFSATGMGSAAHTVLFYVALGASRVGLWSFDLCALQILQVSLEKHPRRSRFSAMQSSLSSVFDLTKFAVVLVLHRPDQ